MVEFLILFLLLYFLTNYALKYFFPQQFGGETATPPIIFSMQTEKVRQGNDPIIQIENTTDKDLTLPDRCPNPPVDIALITTGQDGKEQSAVIIPNEAVLPCTPLTEVKAHTTVTSSLAGWKYALFQDAGTYSASLELPKSFTGSGSTEQAQTVSVRFSVVEPGIFTKLFRTFISKPLFNALIFVGTWVPGHSLGWAIIILTVLIKLILLIPNQHALEGQRKMQLLQPRMDEIKKKYPNDPTKVQEETMKLWKEMKINPLQSCLPMLLQLPILIGLFYVIREGVHIATSRHMIYSFYADLPAEFFSHTFFGLDLLVPERMFFPIALVVLQFIQMKMMMKKEKKTDEIVVNPPKKSWMPELNQQTVMTYVLPLMIGYFAFTFPAAVSLYWGVSTLFGIAQQWYVMREKLKV